MRPWDISEAEIDEDRRSAIQARGKREQTRAEYEEGEINRQKEIRAVLAYRGNDPKILALQTHIRWQRDRPDIFDDEETADYVKALFNKFQKADPELGLEEAHEKVAAVIDKVYGSGQDRQAMDIAEIADKGKRDFIPHGLTGTDTNKIELGEDGEVGYTDDSEVIAKMREGRMPHKNEAMERENARRARDRAADDQRRKAQRGQG